MRRATTWIAWMSLLACGPVSPGSDDTGALAPTTGGTTTGGTSGGRPTGGLEGSSTGGISGVTAAPASTSSEGTETGAPDDGGIILPPDLSMEMCDPFAQNCPDGYKCAPYADDGGSSWNADKCVPVMEDPAQWGEPCIATGGGYSGIDNCDVGLLCWDVDVEGNGYCAELCNGDAETRYCEAPGYYCVVYAEAANPLCLEGCDPVAQNCDASDVCIANPTGGFLCKIDASGDEGQAHDPCAFANACDPGLLCNDPMAAEECDPNANGCCEPFCDLSDPEADSKCPGVGQVCNPYYEEGSAPPEYEIVGYCAVPM